MASSLWAALPVLISATTVWLSGGAMFSSGPLMAADAPPNANFSMPLPSGEYVILDPTPANWQAHGQLVYADGNQGETPTPALEPPGDASGGLQVGAGTSILVSQRFLNPADGQQLDLELRGRSSDQVLKIELQDPWSLATQGTFLRLSTSWQRYTIPVNDLSGANVSLRISPFDPSQASYDVGRVFAPKPVLPHWQFHRQDDFLQLTVKSDRDGPFLAIWPLQGMWYSRVKLVSEPFMLPPGCGALTVDGWSRDGNDSVELLLQGNDGPHRLGVSNLSSAWHMDSLPLPAGLTGQPVMLQALVNVNSEVHLRGLGVPACNASQGSRGLPALLSSL